MLRGHDAACAALLARVRPAQDACSVKAGPLSDDGDAAADGDDAARWLHAGEDFLFRNYSQLRFSIFANYILSDANPQSVQRVDGS